MGTQKLVLCILLITTFNSFSQNGEIIYEASRIKFDNNRIIKNDSISDTQKSYLISVNNNKEKVLYSLIFNQNESFFRKKKPLKDENAGLNLTIINVGKGVYYTNNRENIIINQKTFSGQEFLIEIPVFGWKLSQEQKKIGNYLCHKATTIKYLEGRNGKIERKVIAWYSLEIPYNFGPKEYSGLPGLILELQEDNLLISAKKITLNPKPEPIIKNPKNGKKVSLIEYDSIVKETYYKRRKN